MSVAPVPTVFTPAWRGLLLLLCLLAGSGCAAAQGPPATPAPPLTRVFPKWESVAAAGSVCLPRVGLGQARRERLSPVV